MSIDIYQQCPCHEEKKIKFCCGKAVIDDLNDALAKHHSGQSQAALEQLERAMEKAPKRLTKRFWNVARNIRQDFSIAR